ncbi:T9SS type A sorting domain-containing protein [bacterium]|nr:T9SS type A sorting domain-containing protein [bacterium]
MQSRTMAAILLLVTITCASGSVLGNPGSRSALQAALDGAMDRATSPGPADKSIAGMTPVGSWLLPGNPERLAVEGDLALISSQFEGLVILDVSDPANPHPAGANVPVPGGAIGIAVAGSHAYVADSQYGLRVIDISDPANAAQVGSFTMSGFTLDVAVSGDLVFLVQFDGRVRTFDVSNPTLPIPRDSTVLPGAGYSIEAQGTMIYVIDTPNLTIIEASDPGNLVILGSHVLPGAGALSVAVKNGLAYVGCYDQFRILDVTDPAAIEDLGGLALQDRATDVWLRDDFAYVANNELGVRIIDVSDPADPVEVGHHDPGDACFGVREVGDLVAFTSQGAGFFISSNDLLHQAGPDLDVVITVAGPLTIPATGGSFTYDVSITNTTATDILATAQVDAILPNGSTYPVTTVPDVLFRAGATVVRTGIRQDVPAAAPAGNYTFRVGVGSASLGIIDTEAFAFEKLPVGGLSVAIETWATRGWNERAAGPPPAAAKEPNVHPNPFNPRTTISFTLERSGPATVRVFDAAGRLVRTLAAGSTLNEGAHALEWDGRDDAGRPVPSGTYLARLETADFAAVRKMALLK